MIEPDLLRFAAAGSVDDGKSTLIGRLLYDSKSIFEDQLSALDRTSRKRGQDGIDLSLLTDGLLAEREQGITIDVAYRYFATPQRKFIIADTPGHEQYTRNMVTGASTADLAIILVDARKGVLTQSRRHAYLASLLGMPHLVVAVNKMDLVDYSQAVFEQIQAGVSRRLHADLARRTSNTCRSRRCTATWWSRAAKTLIGTTARRCSNTGNGRRRVRCASTTRCASRCSWWRARIRRRAVSAAVISAASNPEQCAPAIRSSCCPRA